MSNSSILQKVTSFGTQKSQITVTVNLQKTTVTVNLLQFQ